MTTTTKMNRDTVLRDICDMHLGVPMAQQNLDSIHDSPMVASKGAGSVCVLRRRCGTGWRYLGYAVWSCRSQQWVCGSWRTPVSATDAHDHLVDMAWEG